MSYNSIKDSSKLFSSSYFFNSSILTALSSGWLKNLPILAFLPVIILQIANKSSSDSSAVNLSVFIRLFRSLADIFSEV